VTLVWWGGFIRRYGNPFCWQHGHWTWNLKHAVDHRSMNVETTTKVNQNSLGVGIGIGRVVFHEHSWGPNGRHCGVRTNTTLSLRGSDHEVPWVGFPVGAHTHVHQAKATGSPDNDQHYLLIVMGVFPLMSVMNLAKVPCLSPFFFEGLMDRKLAAMAFSDACDDLPPEATGLESPPLLGRLETVRGAAAGFGDEFTVCFAASMFRSFSNTASASSGVWNAGEPYNRRPTSGVSALRRHQS
jgi:hypothetical protein